MTTYEIQLHLIFIDSIYSTFYSVFFIHLQELCQRPQFIADNCMNNLDGPRFDVELGELGDVWLLAAISSLTLTPRFLDRVVPPDQSFDSGNYCGLFRWVVFYSTHLLRWRQFGWYSDCPNRNYRKSHFKIQFGLIFNNIVNIFFNAVSFNSSE